MICTVYYANDRAVAVTSSGRIHNFTDKSNFTSNSERAEYVSRRRAFCRGSNLLYLYQERFTTFLTLTYKKQHSDYSMILNDLKNLFSRNKITYIAVVEKHKSGFYHIHAICSDIPFVSLRKGKYSCPLWTKGFSDVKFLKDTDSKFKVEKYIFKYMSKSKKIGGRYFLKSRDLKIVKNSTFPHNYNLDYSSRNDYNIDGYNLIVERSYYERLKK